MSAPEMRDCAKYDRCSCALCPLDKDWRKRGVDQSDPVCPYLLEMAKPGDAVERFTGRYDLFSVEAASTMFATLKAEQHPRYADTLRRIAAASSTPNMVEQEARRARNLSARAAQKQDHVPSVCRDVPGEPAADVSDPVQGVLP
jgi:hypothetical protein